MSIEKRYAAVLRRRQRAGYDFRFVGGGSLTFVESTPRWMYAWGYMQVPFGFTGRTVTGD